MAKRVVLFLIVNVLVMASITLALNLLGVQPYLTARGISYQPLMIFCLMWGMGGAFISLLLSKPLIKWKMNIKILNNKTISHDYELKLVAMVHKLSRKAGITGMPEVGIYESMDINAFATGATKNSSLVAVSTALLHHLDEPAVEGVVGHEVAHIANGDMVTMSLVSGVVNSFVLFFSRLIASVILRGGNDRENRGPNPFLYFIVVQLLDMVFMLFGSMLVAWFSRYREYRADAGGANLAGKEKMIMALQALQQKYEVQTPDEPENLAAFKISGKRSSWLSLFATHPPLADRISKLKHG